MLRTTCKYCRNVDLITNMYQDVYTEEYYHEECSLGQREDGEISYRRNKNWLKEVKRIATANEVQHL